MKKKELLEKYDELIIKYEDLVLNQQKLRNHLRFLTFQANPCPEGYRGQFNGDGFCMECIKKDG